MRGAEYVETGGADNMVNKTGLWMCLFALMPMSAAGQVEVQVAGKTATQALLVYRSPVSGPCTAEVSESPTLTPLVHDVNPALFVAANQDDRPGSLRDGENRYFVVGKRAGETASDGKVYSRALQAFTRHYFRINCGAQTGTGEFVTENPPVGETATESPNWNAQGFGNYGWPTIDWSDMSKVYVDPQTGIALKRVGAPGWLGINRTNRAFSWQLMGENWTGAGNILSTNSVATYSGAGQEPIVIAPSLDQYNDPGSGSRRGLWIPSQSFDDLRLKLFGSGTDGNSENRKVEVCLSFNDSGASCDTPYQEIMLPQSDGSVSFPSNYPRAFFAGWGGVARRDQFGVYGGTLSVTGNTAVVDVSFVNFFNVNWKNGAKIWIQGTDPTCPGNLCTIESVTNASMLTLRETLTVSNANWRSVASAIRIRKKTGSGTVRLRASFDLAHSFEARNPGNGSLDLCSQESVTVTKDAAGNAAPARKAHLCMFGIATNGSPVHYLTVFFPDNGENRLLSVFQNPSTWNGGYFSSLPTADRPGNLRVTSWGAFVNGMANCVFLETDGGSGRVFWRLCYQGDYRAYTPGYATDADPGTGVNDNMEWVNLTKPSEGRSPMQQVAAANPLHNATEYPTVTMEGASGGYIVAASKVFTGTQQDTAALVHAFDGATGNLKWTSSTYGSYPNRWNTFHGLSPIAGGYAWLLGNAFCRLNAYNGCGWQYLAGPWQETPSHVWKNGNWSANTSLTATAPMDACSEDLPEEMKKMGAVGNRCMRMRTRQPCNQTPHASGEAERHPCPWNPAYSKLQDIAVGDQLAIYQTGVGSPLGEQMLVAKIVDAGDGTLEVELMRGAVPSCTGNAPGTVASGWKYMMVPNGSCDGDSIAHAIQLGGQGQWLTEYWRLWGGHTTVGYGEGENRTVATSGVPGGGYGVRFNLPISQQVGQSYNVLTNADGRFEGVRKIAVGVQSYPSLMQSQGDTRWLLDINHLNPSGGVGAEVKSAVGTMANPVPVSGTSQVYRSAPIVEGPLDLKRFYPVAWAGAYLLKDMSGAGSLITDNDVWRYCIARVAGECRPDSTPGAAYWNVPQSEQSASCTTNWFTQRYPCVASIHVRSNAVTQTWVATADPEGWRSRKITMGFNGFGRHYHYSNAISESTGQWAFFVCFHCDGARSEWFAAKLPPWPNPEDLEPGRNRFQKTRFRIGAQEGLTEARIRFGYAENGNPDQFHCSSRQETCVAVGEPFSWESENAGWQSCTNGCELTVAALSGRILYYARDRRTATGEVQHGRLEVMVVP